MAMAKDYNLFSLDLPDGWVEMMPEVNDGTGTYMLNVVNNEAETMAMITTVKAPDDFDDEAFETAAKVMVQEMQKRGMQVKDQYFDDDVYVAKGVLQKMPFEMHILVKDGMVLNLISADNNIDEGLDLIDEIEVKQLIETDALDTAFSVLAEPT